MLAKIEKVNEKKETDNKWLHQTDDEVAQINPRQFWTQRNRQGQFVPKSDVTATLRSMKNIKVAGNDNVRKEMLGACDGAGIRKLTKILNKIWDPGYIPQHEWINLHNNS